LLRTLFFYTTFFPFTLLCIGYLLLSALLGGEERLHASARQWARGCLWLGGVRLRIEGIEHLPVQGPVVYMSNHQGNFDVPVLFAGLPVQFRWLAKAELFRIPLFGLTMRIAGYIPVERQDRRLAIQSMNLAAGRVAAGTSIMIFPEGTRSPDGTLLPFKKGGFVLALQAQAPIVPIVIDGSAALMIKSSWRIRSGEVRLQIFPAIPTAGLGMKDRDALLAQVEARIASALVPTRRAG
jgi:1-acyl-sn-glycerol-3-phosphate acyltransferase